IGQYTPMLRTGFARHHSHICSAIRLSISVRTFVAMDCLLESSRRRSVDLSGLSCMAGLHCVKACAKRPEHDERSASVQGLAQDPACYPTRRSLRSEGRDPALKFLVSRLAG